MRFFIDLSYDGAPFHGWQKQPNAITVQETIEQCFQQIFQEEIKLVGAGRTDTGVHARQCIAHFDHSSELDLDNLQYRLNRMLPAAIGINSIYPVAADAHARFNAVSREYNYYISTRKDPFTSPYSCFIRRPIDIEAMNACSSILKQHRNFQCFSKVKTDVKTYNCIITQANWVQQGDLLIFTIRADRFLRNMVRAIVGTLVEIGLHQKTSHDLTQIIASKDRCQAGKSIAAKGLFLNKIEYPNSITAH